ncbi:hypothetical protein ACP6PL_15845 [Dapis sp. BLCC M126]|uniref:hypothetical protein n=1 Tax=Dapis sp. BLCC M126 TaxID=3400189 RepID=UPI003CEE86C4
MSDNQSQQSSSELESGQGNNNTVPKNLLESDKGNDKSAPEDPPATPIHQRTDCSLNSGNQLQQSSSELESLKLEQLNRSKLQK